MHCQQRLLAVGILGLSLAWCPELSAQAPVPPSPAPAAGRTVWHALGIPQTYTHFHDALANRLGHHPGLERKPPLKRLADPANLAAQNKAIAAAAKIKAEEDLAPQKKKALKYLAEVGCGCYPGVAEAFMEALEDCTEDVRLAAARAIEDAAGNGCAGCNSDSCCSEELVKKLAERAYERDEDGCWLEPSERVRAALQRALRACCPGGGPAMQYELYQQQLQGDPLPGGDPSVPPPAVPEPADAIPTPPSDVPPVEPENSASSVLSTRLGSYIRIEPVENNPATAQVARVQPAVASRSNPQPPVAAPVLRPVQGRVVEYNATSNIVVIQYDENTLADVREFGTVYHQFLLGTERVGELQLFRVEAGVAYARPIRSAGKIARGDLVELMVRDLR